MKPVPKIRHLREKLDLTQRDLSLLVGVTESTIANWEKGRSGIEWIEKLIKLCRVLQCNLEDLIEYTPKNSTAPPPFSQVRDNALKKQEKKLNCNATNPAITTFTS